jgi:hypothetical protein
MILKTFLEILMIVCGVVTLMGAIMGVREWFLIRRLSKLNLSQLPVKKTTYCQMVLDWCHDNIAYPKTSKPILQVNYYPHKRWSGVYYSGNHLCVIYVNNHDTIQAVTNSVIHEYVHARQRNKNFDKMYEKYQRDFGYELNPLEQESRKVAKDREVECMLWVCRQLSNS